ncbi:hypothetical protein BUALT_Bualt19G0126700 [Buddleja alternifolia]|uniref:Uncharacterized protein n=1 Tax=Buddleja alternifolia TaxID=168488 RepID=A0AAV6WBJ0_9LAMI|nr:hypothetical protein BUALT_Bualt19G0126700 [Buddleja alternifolia]
MHCSLCGKRDHNKKGCHKRKQYVDEGLDISAPLGRGRGRKKKPSNMTEGESSATAAQRGRGKKRKQKNHMNSSEAAHNNPMDSSGFAQPDHIDEGLQSSLYWHTNFNCAGNIPGSNDVASPTRVTRRNTIPLPPRATKSIEVPSPARVQNDSSTSANIHAQSKVKSTRVESVAPNVQKKSKSLGIKRNLQVHNEVSKTTVSSQPEIRAKDNSSTQKSVASNKPSSSQKPEGTQQPNRLRKPALTKSLSTKQPTSLTRPVLVPPISSLLDGVRFSTTKRKPHPSMGTSATEEQPTHCSQQ